MMSKAAYFLLSQLRTCTSAGRVWLRLGVRPLPKIYPHSKVGTMAELNKHVTQMVVVSDITTTFAGGSVVAEVVKSCVRA